MSTNITLKRSAVEGRAPTTGDLALGEIAINTFDGKVFIKKNNGTESVVEVGAGTGGGGGGITWSVKTANYTAATDEGIVADTSGGSFTVTLPSSPSAGDYVVIADGGDWATNNLTVARNGSTIEGDAEDMTMNIGGVSVEFIYDGTTWQIYTAAIASAMGDYVTTTGTQTLTNKTLTSPDINGGTIDGTVIGGATPAAISGTTGSFSGDVTLADKIVHSGDTNTAIRFPATDTVTVETAGSERLRITSAGNVGIGTSSPSSRLHTVGNTFFDGSYTEKVFAVTGTTPALSPTNGSIQTWALSGNSTPTAGTWASGQSITILIDDGTAHTITWTTIGVVFKTDGGVAPTLNTSGDTVIALWKVGTTIYGARVGDA